MMDHTKYQRQYFLPPAGYTGWAKQDYISHAPRWCSVDLRDGNQALVVPMTLEKKIRFFSMLVDIGFKEIEIGFPAASETEYLFVRMLAERHMIPDDVRVQVLTQAREHIIKKTFEALKGIDHAAIHLYNATATIQRQLVYGMSEDEVVSMATDGVKMIRRMADASGKNYSFEYSPESSPGLSADRLRVPVPQLLPVQFGHGAHHAARHWEAGRYTGTLPGDTGPLYRPGIRRIRRHAGRDPVPAELHDAALSPVG